MLKVPAVAAPQLATARHPGLLGLALLALGDSPPSGGAAVPPRVQMRG